MSLYPQLFYKLLLFYLLSKNACKKFFSCLYTAFLFSYKYLINVNLILGTILIYIDYRVLYSYVVMKHLHNIIICFVYKQQSIFLEI